jgi:DNA repair protein RadC
VGFCSVNQTDFLEADMELFLPKNVHQNIPTAALLRDFYGEDAGYILEKSGVSLRRLLQQPLAGYEAARCRLLSAYEIVRRAWLEDLFGKHRMEDLSVVKEYLRLHFMASTEERFVSLWFNAHNSLLAAEDLFRGTISQTVVSSRKVVYHALTQNAAGAVFAHNQSGVAEPSSADQQLINNLKQTLQRVDVKVRDYYIFGEHTICSFVERGLL